MATMVNHLTKAVINLCRSFSKVPVICPTLTKPEFSRRISVKTPRQEISRQSFQREPSCSLRTEGRTEGEA
jgi:hypothetical protein